jgi:nascent polypeptide-associated complex subunit alpha
MIPGLGGMDPKKMMGLMKQMGIDQEEIDSERVIIETKDGGKIVVENAQVVKITMKGQDSFQVQGDVSEGESKGYSEDDVKLVMEKTGKDEERVKKVLEEVNGEVAEAIVKLSS